MTLQVVDWKWFSGVDTVGYVLCEDVNTGVKRGYLGVAVHNDEKQDIQHIKDFGCKLSDEHTKFIFGDFV